MVKQKCLTDGLNIIFDVSYLTNQNHMLIGIRRGELWYNTTFHVFTGFISFKVVNGRKREVMVHFLEAETQRVAP